MKAFPRGTPIPHICEDFYVDISQDVKREPWGGKLGTVATNTVWYSYACDALMSGRDQLVCHGMPDGIAPSSQFTNADLTSLSGEQFSLPSIGLISMIYYCNPYAPWWAQDIMSS